MKIGVSTYSYFSLLNTGKTLFDFIDYTADAGFDFIEFVDLKPDEGQSMADYARQVAAHTKKRGLGIASYTIGADLINGSDGDQKAEVKRLKECLDVAAILGAPLMRHDATWGFRDKSMGRNYKDAIKLMLPFIREVADYAKTLGIKTMVENHGYFMQESHRVEELILSVDRENFGWLVDMGNFVCAEESPLKGVAVAAPYAFHAHAKDFLFKPGTEKSPGEGWFGTRGGNHLRGTIIGHGIIPVAQCINILKASGYDGTISVEFEGMENSLVAVKSGLAFLKGCLQ